MRRAGIANGAAGAGAFPGNEGGKAVNTGHALEAEADQMGAKAAVQIKPAYSDTTSGGSYGGGTLQNADSSGAPLFEAYEEFVKSEDP
jgi:hypothetical protein